MTNSYFFFWQGPFSQWYACRLELKGQTYGCAEQYMMHQKALTFADYEMASAIIATSDPGEQKSLGRSVRGYVQSRWEHVREQIVFEGNLAKFSQNKGLRRKLFQTGDALLAEASPIDAIWGIGLSIEQAKQIDPQFWPGKNLLGTLLTRVRNALRAEFPEEVENAELLDGMWRYEVVGAE